MKLEIYLAVFLVAGAFISQGASQPPTNKIIENDHLPALSKPVDCGLALRYIDDALSRAYQSKTPVIFIIRLKNGRNTTLARTRSTNLKGYVRFRRFDDFEVLVDMDASKAEQIDILLDGKLTYTLPINREDKLELSGC
jgi:hypothetical protein